MKQRQAILTSVILLLLSFQVLVLVILALFPYSPDPGLSSLNNHIYEFLAPLSTIFLLGLLYAWLIKLGTREARHYSRRSERLIQFFSEPFRALVSSIKTRSISDSAPIFQDSLTSLNTACCHPRRDVTMYYMGRVSDGWKETLENDPFRNIPTDVASSPGNQFRQLIRFLDELLLSRI